jgi:hypothetical protein
MKIFKHIGNGVYETCDIDNLRDMSQRVEKLRQTAERLRGAVIDFDGFMARKYVKGEMGMEGQDEGRGKKRRRGE